MSEYKNKDLGDAAMFQINRLLAKYGPETLVLGGVEACSDPISKEEFSPAACAGTLKGHEERSKARK